MGNDTFKISQGIEILPPNKQIAYPVPCNEWNLIKSNIQKISFSNGFLNSLGWAFIGAGASLGASIICSLLLDINSKNPNFFTAWVIMAALIIIGALCLFFSHELNKFKNTTISTIQTQMEIIEERFIGHQLD